MVVEPGILSCVGRTPLIQRMMAKAAELSAAPGAFYADQLVCDSGLKYLSTDLYSARQR